MSKYIIKTMYLQKSKRPIIWNGGSSFQQTLKEKEKKKKKLE